MSQSESEQSTFELIHQKLTELENITKKENEELKKEIEMLRKQLEEREIEAEKLKEEVEELRKKQHIPKPQNFQENINKAASQNDLSSIKYILQDAPDLVNQHDLEHLDTPLHEAVWKSHFEIVKYLIEKGADINSKNKITYFNFSYRIPLFFNFLINNLLFIMPQ